MNKYCTRLSFILIFTIVSCSFSPIKTVRAPSSITQKCRTLLSKLMTKGTPEVKPTESFLREDISYEQVKKNISLKSGAMLEQKTGDNQVLQYLIDPSSPEVKSLLEKVATDTKKMKPDEKIEYLDDLFTTITEQDELASLKLRRNLNKPEQGLLTEDSCVFCVNNPLLFNLVMSEANLRPQLNY